ncbi:MAG: hypothetical protein M1136_11745 [Chloroflexi bacterium]|nr:hypothetical protein [Chloroflexota bacterium]MCL5076294.1 hypothetical protein [Chloroflexota bacterium]
MLKLLTAILVLVLLLLVWKAFRERLVLGLKAGMAVYLIVVAVRLAQQMTDIDRLFALGTVILAFLGIWVAAWAITNFIASRQQ